tara:strand:+ start:646 stop:810 length:165 start_codon:yes stop_codon:yes gene_type:complete
LNLKPVFNNIKKKGDPKNQIYNKNNMKKILWSHKIKINEGLKKYILWFKKNQKK